MSAEEFVRKTYPKAIVKQKWQNLKDNYLIYPNPTSAEEDKECSKFLGKGDTKEIAWENAKGVIEIRNKLFDIFIK